MILTDDNFTTIVHAIEEGRNIYNNIKKSVYSYYPVIWEKSLQFLLLYYSLWYHCYNAILWINLITDSLPAIALELIPVMML